MEKIGIIKIIDKIINGNKDKKKPIKQIVIQYNFLKMKDSEQMSFIKELEDSHAERIRG
jgi:hypothetical protein